MHWHGRIFLVCHDKLIMCPKVFTWNFRAEHCIAMRWLMLIAYTWSLYQLQIVSQTIWSVFVHSFRFHFATQNARNSPTLKLHWSEKKQSLINPHLLSQTTYWAGTPYKRNNGDDWKSQHALHMCQGSKSYPIDKLMQQVSCFDILWKLSLKVSQHHAGTDM